MKRLMVIVVALCLGFSFPLMAKDHGDQGKHKGHSKHRDKYYQKAYYESYHHGRHRHYRRDHHGHLVPVYIVGYHEHVCDVDHGYYNDNGNFIDLNVDSGGNTNLRLNLDLSGH